LLSAIFFFSILHRLGKHAKRLYPLKVSPKAQIEWGYQTSSDSENDDDENTTDSTESCWITVDKAVLESIPVKGIEKLMGFEGTPDPTTGFYCVSSFSLSLYLFFFFVFQSLILIPSLCKIFRTYRTGL
jgi:hypothetical protein